MVLLKKITKHKSPNESLVVVISLWSKIADTKHVRCPNVTLVTMVSIIAILRESSVPNTQNDNLENSLLYLNADITETLQCVLGHCALTQNKYIGSLCQLMIMSPNYVFKLSI